MAVLLLSGCSGDPRSPGGLPAPGAADAGPRQPSPDAAPPVTPAVVRFIALGDTGEGNEDQYKVADAMADKCADDGCDFVILLGDNFYDDGVTSADDPQWQTKFEDPYAVVDVPFYAVLGNHDYNGNGLSSDWSQAAIEVQYSEVSSKWNMPDSFYTFRAGPVGFVMLDTNSIFWDEIENGNQALWLPEVLDDLSDATWIFAAGHHPYLSNGKHGNAGDYDSPTVGGFEVPNPVSPVNGAHIKEFFDEHLCGTVDLYMAGHDHNRQWLDQPDQLCGTELVVSGAGAKLTPLDVARNATHFEDYDTEGFYYVVVEGNRMTGQFIDKNGQLQFERTLTK